MGKLHTIKEQAAIMAAAVQNDPEYRLTCLNCKNKVFFVEHTHALQPGHIYSQLGAKEYHISMMCEYCFDKITAEPEEEA